MEMITIFREFAQAAAPAAIAALWQGAVLAAGLAISLRFMPRLSAADRFRVCAAGFLAAAMLPFLPWLSSLGIGTTVVAGAGAVAGPRAWLDFDSRWTLVIVGVWLAVSAWRLADLGAHGFRLRRLWKRATPVKFDGAGIGAGIEVCTTRDLDRPSVIGFLRPRILIPDWLLERLTERELEQVVLHEAEHLRRRDDWINLAQKLALAVFPLNPALWWMERRMCREREMACDEAVVRATEKPRDYAVCLASLAERGLERRLARRREALSLGAWQRRPELVERVHRILKRRPGLSPAAARGLLAVVGCGLVLGSVEFARCPQLVAFVAPPVSIVPDVADTAATTVSRNGYKMVNAMARVPSRAELAAMRDASQAARVHRAVTEKSALATEKNRKDGARTPIAGDAARTLVVARDGARKDLMTRGALQARPNETNAAEETNNTAMAEQTGATQAGQVPVEQLVVFTAWEQVGTQVRSDYSAQSVSEDQTQDKLAVAQRFTVTQLILRVYPNPVYRRTQANGTNGVSTESSGVKNAGAQNAGAGNMSSGSTGSRSNSKPTSISGPVPVQQVIPLRAGWLVSQL